MDFSVWRYSPKGDRSTGALSEISLSITGSLRDLGYSVFYNPSHLNALAGRAIVFNANALPEGTELPPDSIIYNAEQIPEKGDIIHEGPYFHLLRNHLVWDYSQTNIDRLKAYGIEHVVLCPVGYHRSLLFSHSRSENIDVLFYGCLNGRRIKLLEEIRKTRLVVFPLYDVYGKERDRWICKSKLVLNLHFYDKPIFEIFRVAPLLANQVCVVSENGNVDPALESLAQATTAYVSPEQLAQTCVDLVKDKKRRYEIADRGYIALKNHSQVEYVRKAVEAS